MAASLSKILGPDTIGPIVENEVRDRATAAMAHKAIKMLRQKYGVKWTSFVWVTLRFAAELFLEGNGRGDFTEVLMRSLESRSKKPWIPLMREALSKVMVDKLLGE